MGSGGQGGRPDAGNRTDARQRGNANQLHEKYKNLARDAQMQGDRVTAEYYLQFADHYFRVLNEHRARQEEYRERQEEHRERYRQSDSRNDASDDGDADMDDEDPTAPIAVISGLPPAIGANPTSSAAESDEGDGMGDEDERPARGRGGHGRQSRERSASREEMQDDGDEVSAERSPRRRAPRASAHKPVQLELTSSDAETVAQEEAPKPVRRTRRPRKDDAVAPAEA